MNPLSGRKLIFLPGLDGTGISFEPLRDLLPDDVRVQVVRYPNDRCLTFEQTIRWVLHQIPCGQEFIVVAESFSGPVAAVLLGAGLIRATCLILCATFARSPRPLLLKAANRMPLSFFLRLPLHKAILGPFVEGGDKAAEVFLGLWRRIKKIVPPEILVHRLRLIDRMDVRPWLPHLTMPCLYIQASGDRVVPASCLSDFADAVPDLRVRRIKGPHFILQAQPRLCLAAITDIVGRIGG